MERSGSANSAARAGYTTFFQQRGAGYVRLRQQIQTSACQGVGCFFLSRATLFFALAALAASFGPK